MAKQDATEKPPSMEERLAGMGAWLDQMSQRGRERTAENAVTQSSTVEEMRRQWAIKRRGWRLQRLEGDTARDRFEQRVDDALAELEVRLDDAATDLEVEEAEAAEDAPGYVKAVEAQLDAITSRLDALRARAVATGSAAVGQERMDALTAQVNEVRHRADGIGAQAGGSLQTVEGGVRRAIAELRAAVAEAAKPQPPTTGTPGKTR